MEALRCFEQGTHKLEEGDFDAAKSLYKRCVEIKRNATSLFNLGVTHYHLSMYIDLSTIRGVCILTVFQRNLTMLSPFGKRLLYYSRRVQMLTQVRPFFVCGNMLNCASRFSKRIHYFTSFAARLCLTPP
jgi:hypothetical protein